jgi:hypothetical protein
MNVSTVSRVILFTAVTPSFPGEDLELACAVTVGPNGLRALVAGAKAALPARNERFQRAELGGLGKLGGHRNLLGRRHMRLFRAKD